MYNYLYNGQTHCDTTPEYLKKLGMDDESIEALQRDAEDHEKRQFQLFIEDRNDFLKESDWMVLRHNDQTQLKIQTNMTDDEYIGMLKWRQQLHDMPETMAGNKTTSIEWPTLPPYLEPEFPDYPPKS